MRRRVGVREKRQQVPTIIGAGLTEQWYFRHLRRIYGYRLKISPRYFGNENVIELEKRIERVLSEDGFAVCVFDADVSVWNDVEREHLKEMRRKYSDNRHVLLCDSLPSFEYWFLLHYVKTNRSFPNSKAVIQELRSYIPDFAKSEKFLSNIKWVTDMSCGGRLECACARAREFDKVESDSYSRVYRFFEILGLAV